MTRRFALVCIATLIGLFSVGVTSPAGAASAIVVHPGESIQAAVDAASPGTTIVVQPGTYAENVAITTAGIALRGQGATLVPPASAQPNACSFGDPATDGICGIGEVDFSDPNNPVLVHPLDDVTVSGFTVRGFPGSGVVFFGAHNPRIVGVNAIDNDEYGIARFVSTDGKIVASVATGSDEAGIYVGDSPDANVLLAGNEVSDNLFGFFLRDSAHGSVVGNRVHDNCVGILNLNTGSNEAGNYRIIGNAVFHNDKFCPANDEDGTPPLSGIGVAIVNGHANTVTGNQITDNVPSGDSAFSGGVIVVDGGGGLEPPFDNRVSGNVMHGNQPDIFWDGSGTGNVFAHNACDTSVPDGLC